MSVSFNHTIIFANDKQESAAFFAKLFDIRADPHVWGPFISIPLDHDVLIQFAEPGIDIQPQHYAFLVSESEFDAIYQRILDWELPHSADPHAAHPGTYNTGHGGRGVYFKDPAGHGFEALTRPYV